MAEVILWNDYLKRRPKWQKRLDWLFKVLNKLNRDWVFSWKMRNWLFRFMGVNLPKKTAVRCS